MINKKFLLSYNLVKKLKVESKDRACHVSTIICIRYLYNNLKELLPSTIHQPPTHHYSLFTIQKTEYD